MICITIPSILCIFFTVATIKMSKLQIPLFISVKHEETIKKFKLAVLEREGTLYGNFQAHLVNAMNHYIELLEMTPEDIETVNHKKASVTAMDLQMSSFLKKFEHSLQATEKLGIPERGFMKMLSSHYRSKSDKTIREKRDKIIRFRDWAIIKIPQVRPRFIISRRSAVYDEIRRFDIENYQASLRPTDNEKRLLEYLKKQVLDL